MWTRLHVKQDHQALLMAKYCPRVAAVSRTQKKNHVTWTLTYDNRVLKVVEIHVRLCVQNFIKLSAAVHELSC